MELYKKKVPNPKFSNHFGAKTLSNFEHIILTVVVYI